MPDAAQNRRILSLFFPHLPMERMIRAGRRPGAEAKTATGAAFVLSIFERNSWRIYDLNEAAAAQGIARDMGLSDARALCPGLINLEAAPEADADFLALLGRWALRYCPWISVDGEDGLLLDLTGSAHLAGGEKALLGDLRLRLARAGISVRCGLADSQGLAWGLARFAAGTGAEAGNRVKSGLAARRRHEIAAAGESDAALAPLPVAALRLPPDLCIKLIRLGLRRAGDLIALPRASLSRRFGTGLLMRLDQARAQAPEPLSPAPPPAVTAVRLSFPEPIGLCEDVRAGVARLLPPLCAKLKRRGQGVRRLALQVRRVDQHAAEVELHLARPMHDPARLLRLFERGIEELDAGYGIDQLRLVATQTERLPPGQISGAEISPQPPGRPDGMQPGGLQGETADLVTRLGNRLGLGAITRVLPTESHIPARAVITSPAAFSAAAPCWPRPDAARPALLFAPEALSAPPMALRDRTPPLRFRWRRIQLSLARATGPERIAPEWWLPDENWRAGLRDYWKVETREGRRLWLFHTPQDPAWFAEGEFA